MDITKTVLGIELGSTRIKGVLLDSDHTPIASGAYDWENKLIDGVWTYSMDEVTVGIRQCYAEVKKDVYEKYGVTLTKIGGIGISGMMHGYLVFDNDKNLITPFRTWRNTITGEAAEKLSALLNFNMPQRWSISHLYQAMLSGEEHLARLGYLTTLSGYLHWILTGERTVGIGEASGMFPVDSKTLDYDEARVSVVDGLIENAGYTWRFRDIMPRISLAGQCAGILTADGAKYLDPDGDLESGIPLAPPEGDAGTGMIATNSVRVGTANVSAGTSAFAMVVIDKEPEAHFGIDVVTTPAGKPVAMVHSNTCTTDINSWINLFGEFAAMNGLELTKNELYSMLFKKALEGDSDCGGLLAYNCFSGEDTVGLEEGRPMFVRSQNSRFTLANFIRSHLMTSLSTLKIGLDILNPDGNLKISKICGHGGFFKTPEVGQRMLSAAFGAPVTVMETAGEGGPYGMALLTAYMLWKKDGEPLEDYLDKVFADAKETTVCATEEEVRGFADYAEKYKKALPLEHTAIKVT